MKKILLVSLLALFTVATYAQDNNQRRQGPPRQGRQMRTRFNPEQMAKMETDAINEAVGLDSLQYQLVYIMKYSDMMAMQEKMKERAEKMKNQQKEGATPPAFDAKSREEMMKAREEVAKARREAMNAEMKQILSPKQYKKYLKYEEQKQKNRPKMGEPRKGKMGEPRKEKK